jgi:hypothetical protein
VWYWLIFLFAPVLIIPVDSDAAISSLTVHLLVIIGATEAAGSGILCSPHKSWLISKLSSFHETNISVLHCALTLKKDDSKTKDKKVDKVDELPSEFECCFCTSKVVIQSDCELFSNVKQRNTPLNVVNVSKISVSFPKQNLNADLLFSKKKKRTRASLLSLCCQWRRFHPLLIWNSNFNRLFSSASICVLNSLSVWSECSAQVGVSLFQINKQVFLFPAHQFD